MFSTSRTLSCILLACALAGCATSPEVKWSTAGGSESKPADGSLYTIERGLAQADTQITDIEKKKSEYVERSTTVSNLALGLGLVTTAAAIGKAHHDVLTAGAFGAGTLYVADGLSATKPRMDIYNAGISASTCAKKAVSGAAAVSTAGLDSREKEAKELNGALISLGSAITDADLSLAGAHIDNTDLKSAFQKQLADAVSAEGRGRAAYDVYAEFRRQQQEGAKALDDTLKDIRVKVNFLVGQTVADPKAVFDSLPALFAGMDRAAPGLDLGAAAKKSVEERKAALVSSVPPGEGTVGARAQKPRQLSASERQRATEELEPKFKLLASTASTVLGKARVLEGALPPKGSTAPNALQFKECNVSDAVLALKIVSPADATFRVVLKEGETPADRYVHLSGGVKPYRWLKSGEPNLVSLEQVNPLDSSMTLKISKDAKPSDEVVLVIQDSATPPQTVQLTVKLQAAEK